MPTMCIEMPAVYIRYDTQQPMIIASLKYIAAQAGRHTAKRPTCCRAPPRTVARCQVPSQTERIGCQLIKGVVDYDDSRRLGMCSVMPESLLSSAELLSLIKTSATCGICCTSLD